MLLVGLRELVYWRSSGPNSELNTILMVAIVLLQPSSGCAGYLELWWDCSLFSAGIGRNHMREWNAYSLKSWTMTTSCSYTSPRSSHLRFWWPLSTLTSIELYSTRSSTFIYVSLICFLCSFIIVLECVSCKYFVHWWGNRRFLIPTIIIIGTTALFEPC